MANQLKILLIHNHYQQRGGEDSVFETECAMLRGAGHTVICYEKHNDAICAPQQGLGARGQGLAAEQGATNSERRQNSHNDTPASKLGPRAYGLTPFRVFRVFRSAISLFCKTIWNRTTYREITEIIKREKPDIVHCHNTFPIISPSVYWAAAKQGVPVIQTLHNYRLVCPGAYLFRDRHICEDCLGRSPLRSVIHRCYRSSLAASFTVATMLMIHRLLGTYRNKVTTYIALTEFGRNKFIEARLCSPDKVVVKPNAIAPSSFAKAEVAQGLGVRDQGLADSCIKASVDKHSDQPPALEPSTYNLAPSPKLPPIPYPLSPEHGSGPPTTVLYVGRLSPEKGVDILINSWILCHDKLPQGSRLHIIGDGPERASLESMAKGQREVVFFGSIPHDQIAVHMRDASMLVVPSIWYEQFMITPLEAMLEGTPVIVSDCARHATLITPGETGFIFEAGEPVSLSNVIQTCLNEDPKKLARIGQAGRRACLQSASCSELNFKELIAIYQKSGFKKNASLDFLT